MRRLSEVADYLRMAAEELDYLSDDSRMPERVHWSRLYYAVFYAAKAALAQLGYQPRTHTGTDTLVGGKLYKEHGYITRDDAAKYARLRTIRQTVDYEPGAVVAADKEEYETWANSFVEDMRHIVDTHG